MRRRAQTQGRERGGGEGEGKERRKKEEIVKEKVSRYRRDMSCKKPRTRAKGVLRDEWQISTDKVER